MAKVAVVYWSGTGNTEIMANKVKEGAEAAGAEVTIFTASEFDGDKAGGFEAIAFGCPSTGAEVLEEDEFQPMFDSVSSRLGGKRIALFGSYGWGDGEWMRNWEDVCNDLGVTFACGYVICNGEPDDEGVAACIDMGKALA